MSLDADADFEEFWVEANGLSFHCVAAGPEDGPLVLLLHGFPEFWYGWRRQIRPLAAAGFRVVAPDQRGYNFSDKPKGPGAYRIDVLAADIAALVAALGRGQASLVGHDWGGIVAWWTAARHPEAVRRLAVVNAPHPVAMPGYALRHPGQLLMSWYMAFFQLPGISERLLARRNFAFLRGAMARSSRPGTFSPADLRRYREAWAAPGALTAMLNWYRALRFAGSDGGARITAPTLILWGEQDRFLAAGLAEASAKLCREATVRRFPNATHWLQHEEPDAVTAALIAFLSG